MPRSMLFASGIAFALGGLVAGTAMLGGLAPRPPASAVTQAEWIEIGWPFPADAWGAGKAFRCPASQCGAELSVFVRPKIGFCNCATGVADDEELARIGDLDLLAYRLSARGEGKVIEVGSMKGRSRLFAAEHAKGAGPFVLAIGFNDRCDAIVATAVAGHGDPGLAEARVLTLLNGRKVLGWIEVAIGL